MLIVQKYGGTSMGSTERIKNVATRVSKSLPNNQLVIVVSAMSGVTDEILNYANDLALLPNERDLDMALSSGEQISAALLSIALNAMGYKAIALNGRQARILTDSNHTKARIQSIDTSYIINLLQQNYIVVVTGFQGLSNEGEITTLGRGGSDLSAVALAGALHADLCEIYSDVDGIYTTDPRIESKAKKIDRISYDEMLDDICKAFDFAVTLGEPTWAASIKDRLLNVLDKAKDCADPDKFSLLVYNLVGTGTMTSESVTAALAIAYYCQDVEKAAFLCANMGGDTDTIGAMACAICGAFNGLSSVKSDTISYLEKTNNINFADLADKIISARTSFIKE